MKSNMNVTEVPVNFKVGVSVAKIDYILFLVSTYRYTRDDLINAGYGAYIT